jgi:hypothetical protein
VRRENSLSVSESGGAPSQAGQGFSSWFTLHHIDGLPPLCQERHTIGTQHEPDFLDTNEPRRSWRKIWSHSHAAGLINS